MTPHTKPLPTPNLNYQTFHSPMPQKRPQQDLQQRPFSLRQDQVPQGPPTTPQLFKTIQNV